MEINLDESTGAEKERTSYADLEPAFVIALIQALNMTRTKNMFQEADEYILYKQKYFDELLESYNEWRSDTGPFAGYPEHKKRANVAVMALINSEIIEMGFDEQAEVKVNINNINKICYGGMRYKTADRGWPDKTFCYSLPDESGELNELYILLNLPGTTKKLRSRLKKLTYALRSKHHYFQDPTGTLEWGNVGYHYRRKGTFTKE